MPFFRHPDYRLQRAWNFAQLGLLLFPLIPVLGAVGLFLALVTTWRQQYRQIIRRPLNWGFALLSLWLVVTTCFAHNKFEAFLGLFNLLPFLIFFAAFSALIQTTAQMRQVAWILVVTSVPVVAIGLGQLFLGWTTTVEWQSVLGWAIAPGGNPPGRMASVFMYTNILAAYLAIAFVLGLGLWIDYQKLSSKKLSFLKTRSLPGSLIFLSVAVLGNLIAMILTNSRNAWAIAILACIAFAIYQRWRWIVAAASAITGSVLLAAYAPPPVQQWFRAIVPAFFWARLTDQLYPDRPQQLLRTTQWQFAWFLTQQRPWTGWGLRNFTPLYLAQRQIWLGHPHNLLLLLISETGIPSTILFCSLVGWVLAKGILLLGDRSFFSTRLSASNQDKLIVFTYLVAFFACTIFNSVDVTLFDLRVNTLGWLLLSAICGVVYKYRTYSATT